MSLEISQLLLSADHCSLRLVNEDDADFILKLRADEKKSRYLNKTENNIQKQIQWINSYKKRERKGDEYYFIIQDLQERPVGTYRLYDITDSTATPGSWIIMDGVDLCVPLESVLLMYEFVFYFLNKEKIIFDVRKENKKVVRFHESYGSIRVSETDLDYFYEFPATDFNKMKIKFERYLGG